MGRFDSKACRRLRVAVPSAGRDQHPKGRAMGKFQMTFPKPIFGFRMQSDAEAEAEGTIAHNKFRPPRPKHNFLRHDDRFCCVLSRIHRGLRRWTAARLPLTPLKDRHGARGRTWFEDRP